MSIEHLKKQKKFFEETHHLMTKDNHKQHDLEPNYWNLLLCDVSSINTPVSRALDFGCGCGRNIKNLLDMAKWKQVDGVDISKANADYAKTYALKHHPDSIVHTWENDGATLQPAKDNTYDFIMSHQVLQHICNYDVRYSLLKDMYRILKRDGILSIHFMDLAVATSYYENSDLAINVVIGDPENVVKDLEQIGYKDITYTSTKDFYQNRNEYYFRAVK